jgi:NAD(P)-dependent dehydrogenase (short-subunit alcohol dehydrogenase family)
MTMETLEGKRALVTGGSRGLGLGMVESLRARGAVVTVLARDAARLAEVERRLGVTVVAGDIGDAALAARLVRDLRPEVLILNAGTNPVIAPIHEQRWEDFSAVWNRDVKAGLTWIQEAIRAPLPRGSRVLISSSGAAVGGSPLSGGYAGAKRMLWMMAGYANGVSAELDLGIRFQVIVPMQMIGTTGHGRAAAEGYARRKGVSVEAFLANFGAPMSAQQVGEHVAAILTDPAHESGVAFGLKGDFGLRSLDPTP